MAARKPKAERPQLFEKTMILPGNRHGKVGKSFFVTQLAEWLKRHPIKPKYRLFDLDEDNRTLTRYHKDAVQITVPKGGGNDVMDVIFNALGEVDISIADGVGGQHKVLFEAWVKDTDLLAFARDHKIDITYYLAIENNRDIIRQAGDFMRSTLETPGGDAVRWLMVFNRKQSAEFSFWDNPDNVPEARRIFEELEADGRAGSVDFARLNEAMAQYVEKMALPIARVPETIPGNLEAQRFITKAREYDRMFGEVAPLILPESLVQTVS